MANLMDKLSQLKAELQKTNEFIDQLSGHELDRHDTSVLEGHCDYAEDLQNEIEKLEQIEISWQEHEAKGEQYAA